MPYAVAGDALQGSTPALHGDGGVAADLLARRVPAPGGSTGAVRAGGR